MSTERFKAMKGLYMQPGSPLKVEAQVSSNGVQVYITDSDDDCIVLSAHEARALYEWLGKVLP